MAVLRTSRFHSSEREAQEAAKYDRCASFGERLPRLRARVEAEFWQDDLGFYAVALDGDGQPCRAIASNAGHLLFTGLPSAERARKVMGLAGTVSIATELGLQASGAITAAGVDWPHSSR
mgnify:CR=1 FL=1